MDNGMRLARPRVEPLGEEELPEDARIKMGSGPTLNIFRTLAHHPQLMKRWLVFGNHVLGKSTLSARDRELLILRIGWLCRSRYEWGQHALIALRCEISEAEVLDVARGPDAPGWSAHERALLRATDELHADAFITDETWAELASTYDTQQLMDVVFAVGQYNMVSMALNTLGVQPDAGLPEFPDDAALR